MTPNRSTSIIRFSPGTLVSSTSNTYRHDLTEILLKVPLILNTITLTLTQIVKHQSLWHGVQLFYHCTCIFHINLYDMGYKGSNLYDMGYKGSNLYDMGYNGSIIVLVFSTSIFITWGITVLIFMTWGTTVLIFITWGTMVLSLYLYFPHQSLWHEVQRF